MMAAGAPPHRTIRPPAVAGTFYPANAMQCREAARSLMRNVADERRTQPGAETVERRWLGAVVPHAGWVCSGAIAAQAITELAASNPSPPDVVVVFGAVHTPVDIDFAALDAHDAWQTPGAETELATELSRGLVASVTTSKARFAVEPRLHRHEHAVEVEVPLIREAWPGATLLPIEVPPIDDAVEIGRQTARRIASSGARAVYLASSDLTHYGPAYRFAPAGVGIEGLNWAKDNDRRLLDRITALAAEDIVPEARRHANACGPGAIAAMIAACREVGSASAARLLRHANSYETLASVAPQPPTDAVGYAAIVVG